MAVFLGSEESRRRSVGRFGSRKRTEVMWAMFRVMDCAHRLTRTGNEKSVEERNERTAKYR